MTSVLSHSIANFENSVSVSKPGDTPEKAARPRSESEDSFHRFSIYKHVGTTTAASRTMLLHTGDPQGSDVSGSQVASSMCSKENTSMMDMLEDSRKENDPSIQIRSSAEVEENQEAQ